jgi:hypothetical protein
MTSLCGDNQRMLRVRFMVAAGVVMGALAFSVGASAATISTASYQGAITPSGSVSFDAKIKDGAVRKILGGPGPPAAGLLFDQVPVTCDEGASEISGVLVSNLWVGRDNHFQLVAKTVDPALHGKLRAHGTFADDASSASGTVRAVGSWGESETNCDSGRLSWTAAAVDAGSGTGDGALRGARAASPLRG